MEQEPIPTITAAIKGYRQLSVEEQARINALKELGETVGRAVDEVDAAPGADKRWAAIARTDLQKGFMALIRAIAKPGTF